MNDQFALANKVARPGKRFLAALADLFILFILASGIYSILVYPLMEKLPHYQELFTEQENRINDCRQMYIDGKLMRYDIEPEQYVEEVIKTRLESSNNDIFVHFYTVYMPTLHKNGEPYSYSMESINETVFDYSNQGEPVLWELKDNDKNKPLELSEAAKTSINKYINEEKTKENEAYYTKMKEWVTKSLVEGEKVLTSSDEFKETYSLALEKNNSLYLYVSISSLITYTVFFFLYYLLPPFLFKNGQTVGKKILKIGLYTEDNKPISTKSLILRAVLQYISYFFLVSFIPIFQIGLNITSLPIFVFKTFTINLFTITFISIIVTLVSLAMCMMSTLKQSLCDKVTNVYAFRMDIQLEEENIIKNEEVLGKKEDDNSGSNLY